MSMTDTAIEQFFDGRSFGSQAPSGAHPDYRRAARAAIEHRFGQYDNDHGLARSETWRDDIAVGDTLYCDIHTAYRDRYGTPGWHVENDQRAAAGRWIKALITTHLEEGMTATPITYDDITWPEDCPGGERQNWRESIVRWVNDDINDVQPTVDLQASRTRFVDHASTYFTTGTGKDFLSYLMFRKAQLMFPPGTKVSIHDGETVALSDIAISPSQANGTYEVNRVENETGQVRVRLTVGWFVLPCHLSPITDTAVHSVNTDEVEALKAEVARLKDDIETIGRRFWQEAKDRQWCSEAEQVIAELNEVISVPMPETRPISKWTVRISSSDFGCGYILLSEVEASSADEAKEKVSEALDNMRWSVDFRERFREAADEAGLEFGSSDEGYVSIGSPSYELTATAGE